MRDHNMTCIDKQAAFSPRFNAPDADLVLVPSDDVRFKVHKANLPSQSTVFRDMFATVRVEDGLPEVPVVEPKEVLEVVLPYCYPDQTLLFDLSLPDHLFWQIVKAFDKYGIRSGTDAVALAYHREHYTCIPTNSVWLVQYYLFAVNYSFADVDTLGAVKFILKSGYSWDDLSPLFDEAAKFDVGDEGKLQRLLERRATALAIARGTELQLALTEIWKVEKGGTQFATLGKFLEYWTGAASCTSLRSLEGYRKEHEGQLGTGEVVAKEKLPWEQLKEAIKKLPDRLE